MKQWFYAKDGQQLGPVDEATFGSKVLTGEIGQDDLVWYEGMGDWKPLRDSGFVGQQGVTPVGGSPYSPPVQSATMSAQPDYGPQTGSTNGLAIASLVCGILAVVLFCLFAGIYLGIPAVICGHLALKKLRQTDNRQTGGGMAIAGLICGYLSMVYVLYVAIMFAIGWDGIKKEFNSSWEEAMEEAQDEVRREMQESEEESTE